MKILLSFAIAAFLFTVDLSFAANEFTFAPRGAGLSHCAVLPVGIHPNCGAFEENEDERPSIEAPADVVTEATALQTPKEDVNLGEILPDNNYLNCDECELPEVTNNVPDFFPLGNTQITWIATFPTDDDEGSFSATAEQLVTIIDNTDPQFTDISDLEVTTNNPEGTPLFYNIPTASDAIGIQNVICDPSPGSNFDLGVTQVTCTATDNANNETTGQFSINVTLLDNTPPQFITLVEDLEEETENPNGASVSYDVPEATDDSGSSEVSCNPHPGNNFGIGTTEVVCTATDDTGNENSVSFEVTVILLSVPEPQPELESEPSLKNTISVNPLQAKLPDSGKTTEMHFSGNIENYDRGTPIAVEVFDSLSTKSTFTVFGTDNGSYQFSYTLTNQNPSGKYNADIFYQGQKINSLSFSVIDESGPEKIELPSWIKSNAGWWAEGTLDDKTFVQGIEYMIKEGVIKLPNLNSVTGSQPQSADIPDWIKSNAGWWAEDLITDDDFVKGIKYLVEKGIIVV